MEDTNKDEYEHLDSKLTPYAFALYIMRKVMKRDSGYSYAAYRDAIEDIVDTWGPKVNETLPKTS